MNVRRCIGKSLGGNTRSNCCLICDIVVCVPAAVFYPPGGRGFYM